MGRELVYSGGYSRPYSNDADEVKAAVEFKDWYPSSVDFKATAEASGGGTAVSNLPELIRFLSNKPDGSVDELGIIGHADSSLFAFGGTIIVPTLSSSGNVNFASDKLIDQTSLTTNATAIAAVKAKFSSKGRIILYGCHAGLADALMAAIAKAFGVCVYGFSEAITTGFTSSTGQNPRILSRGHVWVDSAGLLAAGLAPHTGQWSKDVHTLSPNKKSAGCPDIK